MDNAAKRARLLLSLRESLKLAGPGVLVPIDRELFGMRLSDLYPPRRADQSGFPL